MVTISFSFSVRGKMKRFGGSSFHIMRTQLPITRVRKICRIDPDSSTISTEAIQLLTLATERFIALLAKAAHGKAVLNKRKTVRLRDLEFCIRNYTPFDILIGALDGWPELRGAKRDTATASASVADNMPEDEEEIATDSDDEKEQDNTNIDVDGLSNETFGFDESLQGTITAESPFDCEISKQTDDNTAVMNSAQSTEVDENFASETQAAESDVFDHYGFYASTKSAVTATTRNRVVTDIAQDIHEIQMDEEMQVTQALRASAQSYLLKRTGNE